MKKMTVIVPFSNQNTGRLESLNHLLNVIDKQDLRVLDGNGNPTSQRDWEFILVEQIIGDNYTKLDSKGIPDKHIVIRNDQAFNKSWCMNIGAKHANTDWLVFCDADTLFGKEYLYKVNLWRHKTIPNDPFFIGWNTLMKLPGKDEPVARTLDPTAALTAGGVFWIKKDFFWKVGGMNENYFGYGGEDNDFWIRVNTDLGSQNLINVRCSPYAIVHMYHDDAVPSPERFYHLDRVHQYPKEITRRLVNRKESLGNLESPTTFDISDLKLKDLSLSDPNSKGIVA
jgi:predicted glycosyltransferase involved in capsule biosynthesis